MSRIGKKPVPIASGVKIALNDRQLKVDGPKGSLQIAVHPAVKVSIDEGAKQVIVERRDDQRESRALHGLTRSLVANMIQGVSQGYNRSLEVVGVGYRAEVAGKNLVLSVGFANTIRVPIPQGLTVAVEGNKIRVNGIDKQQVGQFAAEVRQVRKPEPYKGKGIRYEGEQVKIKPGKAVTGSGK